MKKRIFIVDHQSYNSLALYDRSMIQDIRDFDFYFFGNYKNQYLPKNENVRFFPVFKYNKHSNIAAKVFSYIRSLLTICFYGIKLRPSIIHLQWIRIWKFEWNMIRFFHGVLKAKTVFTVHNILPHNSLISKNIKKLKSRYGKLYRYCDRLIVHTETSKKELIREFDIPADKIVVMPHGVIELPISDNEIKESAERLEKEHKFGDKLIFAALGAQSYYKGPDLLVEAWLNNPELRDNKNLILLIAGRPIDSVYPENLPDNVVIISETVSNPDFKYLMRRSDVIVLPYRAIDQSGLLLTLIMDSKPYCCTPVGELCKPIEKERIGWVIPRIDAEAIEETLLKILKDPAVIKEIQDKKESWERLQQDYSWTRSNRILDKLYNSLISCDDLQ